MKNYKIVIQYDGTKYKGWQIQNNTSDTIQGKLEDILEKLSGSHVDVIGSGRTDAGVHAIGQVANFHINLQQTMSADDIMNYINEYLPQDIAVISIEEVDERFHARFSAVSKTYMYRIHVGRIPDVFSVKYVYPFTDGPLDTSAMREAAKLLIGTKDYKAFFGNKHMKKSTVRTIFSIDIIEKYYKDEVSEIDIIYKGDGFLQNMVRILTGTLIEVGMCRKSVDDIDSILASLDRENAGFMAPSRGLSLIEVEY